MSDLVATYSVGLGVCDITPRVGFGLAGLSARPEPSTGVYHPLSAMAAAIDDGDTRLLLLTAEWLGFYNLAAQARAAVARAARVDEANVILVGSHTHCGPALRPIDMERGGTIDHAFLDEAIARMAACAAAACADRQPARLRFGVGHCGFGASRRRINAQGLAEFKLERKGPHDHHVPVLAVERPGGGLRGVLFGYACHPTARFGREIGGDYVGFARDRIAADFPSVVSGFLPGCGGDQKPAPFDPAAPDFAVHTIEQVRSRGEELAAAVGGVLRDGPVTEITGPLRVAQRVLTLRTELPRLDEIAAACASENVYMRAWGEHFEPLVRSSAAIDNTVEMEAQAVAFGRSLVMPAVAAELTAEYGLRWRRDFASDFACVFPVAYTNDIVGYVPVRRQIPEGGYEVIDSNRYYRRPGPYVAETEEQINTALREMAGV